jgi:hypothetical protein
MALLGHRTAVLLFSLSIGKCDGLQLHCSTKYLTMCRCPPWAAAWRAILPPTRWIFLPWYLSGTAKFGSHFNSEMKNLTISKCPLKAARWIGACPSMPLLVTMSLSGRNLLSSFTRYLTTLMSPAWEARCSGVEPLSAQHSGSICCSATR